MQIDDLVKQVGPPNVDSQATGTSVRDYRRADTLESLPNEIIGLYDRDGRAGGVLVFDPSVLSN